MGAHTHIFRRIYMYTQPFLTNS
uniref:Uncharacterized protein n=1 Tax=Anguilla anguilla TaxID=7936 RepID=A0A0E9XTT4_ANGAN